MKIFTGREYFRAHLGLVVQCLLSDPSVLEGFLDALESKAFDDFDFDPEDDEDCCAVSDWAEASFAIAVEEGLLGQRLADEALRIFGDLRLLRAYDGVSPAPLN